IPSLREYLLIDQDTPQITHYTRDGGAWSRQDFGGLTEIITLVSVGCQLPFSEIYEGIDFE
ncbi:MAG: Uma2 family endonuclease, partial [Blastocatellia bacterium]